MSDYAFRGVLTGLTPSEKSFLITHPHRIFIIRENAEKAFIEAIRLYPGVGLHNGMGDAFRHCYWSALLARDIGAHEALAFTTAHEGYSNNPAQERAMDLHNNTVGIGRNSSTSDATLSRRCQNALASGKLVITPTIPGRPYNLY